MARRRVGILTGGGDCPGLNAVIRAVTRKGTDAYGYDIVGVMLGWRGMLESVSMPLDLNAVSGILPRGGTILGTSRTNPYNEPDGADTVKRNMVTMELDALIAVGGDDTVGVASRLYEDGVNVIGVPKTIDNDLDGTDQTFGFDTAINTVTDAIDRLHTTAESHNRVMVVEVMGRHAGWIAVEAGIAGGADMVLIPEQPVDLEMVCSSIQKRHDRGKTFSIVVVAEGARLSDESLVLQSEERDAFGHVRLGGIGIVLGEEIERRTGFETRVTVLGHIQRGGNPTAFDRVLGTRFGIAAIDLVHTGDFGNMVALRGTDIVSVPLKDAVSKLRTVDMNLYDIARVFFG
ncbi:MAG: 6-phosphofructokinase [Gemmatimonadetes bacterium]|nr:6-phosphofructokinase [Gemmatimonadota bacterium]MDE3257334.1 6-phosphofructokinase [Gemmatimonadota bacterium]